MNAQIIQLIDIYDIYYHPWWHATWFLVLVGLFVGSLISYIFYRMYRVGWFFKKMSYDQLALYELHMTSQEEYASSEQIYAAYFRVTKIFKTYLACRYQLALHDKSDIEIVPLLSDKIEQSWHPVLQEFFQRSFQIKFAQDTVSESMLQDDIQFIKKFIEQTRSVAVKVGNS